MYQGWQTNGGPRSVQGGHWTLDCVLGRAVSVSECLGRRGLFHGGLKPSIDGLRAVQAWSDVERPPTRLL